MCAIANCLCVCIPTNIASRHEILIITIVTIVIFPP